MFASLNGASVFVKASITCPSLRGGCHPCLGRKPDSFETPPLLADYLGPSLPALSIAVPMSCMEQRPAAGGGLGGAAPVPFPWQQFKERCNGRRAGFDQTMDILTLVGGKGGVLSACGAPGS